MGHHHQKHGLEQDILTDGRGAGRVGHGVALVTDVGVILVHLMNVSACTPRYSLIIGVSLKRIFLALN